MEKNVILAIALSIAVLVASNYLMPKPVPMPQKTAQETPASIEGAAKQAGALAPEAAQGATPLKTALPEAPAKEITVDTDLYKAVLSTRGGVIQGWLLKKYTDVEGRPTEMVIHKGGVMPLLVVPDGTTWEVAQGYNYSTDKDSIELTAKDETGEIVMRSVSPDGRTLIKRLRFTNGTYAVAVDVFAEGYKGYTLYTGDSFGSITPVDGAGGRVAGYIGPICMVDGQREKDEAKKLEQPKLHEAKSGWAGITDKYLIAVAIPADGMKVTVSKGISGWGLVGFYVPSGGAVPKGSMQFYAGPKEYDLLKAMGKGLDQAVDFGWFTFLAKPLFVVLKYFFGVVKNYGWSIIIITLIIKALFAPLTHKSQKSMKRMQKLQPHFAALKEKYKGDPQRLNKEMMELYKTHKVNPMGGCLPMVVQIPVFIALYNVLNNSIELRHAPFVWWLTDLSAKDPYYVLPVLMGVSMLVMQKMTPSTMDPMQNKIMMIMPVVMTAMFISLPSGLVLYFTISNALSMAQQLYINKYSKVD